MTFDSKRMNRIQVCMYFVLLHMKEELVTYDPIQASVYMNQEWGIRLDWHEMSMALDVLKSNGEVTLVGHRRSGMCKYINN